MSIFQNTANLGTEDISTEILAYFLTSPDRFISFQKLFFQRIVGHLTSASESNADILPQKGYKEGRPDLTIITNTEIIIIENKLISLLSSESQLLNYCDILNEKQKDLEKEEKTIYKKYLVFIAPQSTIESEIPKNNRTCKQKKGKDFKEFCTENKIEFKEINWGILISDLDKSDSLQNELYLYVSNFLLKGLTMEEKEVLKNNSVPIALKKIYQKIYTISTNNFPGSFKKQSRVSQSYQYYGFYIGNPKIKFWFGFNLERWEKFNTPVFLELYDNKLLSKKKLEELSFKKDNESSDILPFPIENENEWTNILKLTLSKVEEELNS